MTDWSNRKPDPSNAKACSTCGTETTNPQFCSVPCYDIWQAAQPKVNILSDHDTQTKGYAGYNHGLDTVIQDKGHWKAEMKRQGVVDVG